MSTKRMLYFLVHGLYEKNESGCFTFAFFVVTFKKVFDKNVNIFNFDLIKLHSYLVQSC